MSFVLSLFRETLRLLPAVRLGAVVSLVGSFVAADQGVGADLPWSTFEAEAMRTSGAVIGPAYGPHRVESESSGQRCVQLTAVGEFVEFTATAAANAMVIRYSLPDAEAGGGTQASLDVLVNGRPARSLALTSRYAWLYGNYSFHNDPVLGKPRNFYDEVRLKDVTIVPGDVVRLQRGPGEAAHCIIDLVDLENVAPALSAPANALSVLEFGAKGDGKTDDTEALKRCVADAARLRRPVWVPAGEYKLTGDLVLPSFVTIQGAGMWHTTFVGDEVLYPKADRRVRFKLAGEDIHLADFSIVGRLNYRQDSEPNDGIVGAGCEDSSVSRIWIEHTKVGVWIYNGTNLRIQGCRFRNMLADGVNLCVGTSGCVVENCSARGTGDDCFAIWPAPADQGFVGRVSPPGNNVIRRCTGQLTFLANGGSIYGGVNNRIEDCLFTDIGTGCGVLISTSFETNNADRSIDNNFSGTTVVQNTKLLRCGGYDHTWTWRGSLQICMERRSISGVTLRDVEIRDSFSSGVTVVGPGSSKGEGTLSATRLENVRVINPGLGTAPVHGLWVRDDATGGLSISDSDVGSTRNDSPRFAIEATPPASL